jgi:hypothetical protein
MCHSPITIDQVARTQNKTIQDDWSIQDGFNCADYDFVLVLSKPGLKLRISLPIWWLAFRRTVAVRLRM